MRFDPYEVFPGRENAYAQIEKCLTQDAELSHRRFNKGDVLESIQVDIENLKYGILVHVFRDIVYLQSQRSVFEVNGLSPNDEGSLVKSLLKKVSHAGVIQGLDSLGAPTDIHEFTGMVYTDIASVQQKFGWSTIDQTMTDCLASVKSKIEESCASTDFGRVQTALRGETVHKTWRLNTLWNEASVNEKLAHRIRLALLNLTGQAESKLYLWSYYSNPVELCVATGIKSIERSTLCQWAIDLLPVEQSVIGVGGERRLALFSDYRSKQLTIWGEHSCLNECTFLDSTFERIA